MPIQFLSSYKKKGNIANKSNMTEAVRLGDILGNVRNSKVKSTNDDDVGNAKSHGVQSHSINRLVQNDSSIQISNGGNMQKQPYSVAYADQTRPNPKKNHSNAHAGRSANMSTDNFYTGNLYARTNESTTNHRSYHQGPFESLDAQAPIPNRNDNTNISYGRCSNIPSLHPIVNRERRPIGLNHFDK